MNPFSKTYRPVLLRCRKCTAVLDELRAHPTVTRMNISGTNHRPDNDDLRRSRVEYEVEAPRSWSLDKHVWRCKCGAEWESTTEKLEAAFLGLQGSERDLVAGVDLA